MENKAMKKHEYTIMIIGEIVKELIRCAEAGMTVIKLQQACNEISENEFKIAQAHLLALCEMQDRHLNKILEREIELERQERNDENEL